MAESGNKPLGPSSVTELVISDVVPLAGSIVVLSSWFATFGSIVGKAEIVEYVVWELNFVVGEF